MKLLAYALLRYSSWLAVFFLFSLPAVQAAPFDTRLNAHPARHGNQGELEVAYDFMNEHFDFVGLSDDYDGATDYRGGHLRGGLAFSERLWVDGSLWRRELEVGSFAATLDTWQLAAQYRLLDGGDDGLNVALRAGAWGNGTDEISRRYNLLSGATSTSSIHIDNPHDSQTQLDLIASLALSTRTTATLFVSAGNSRVDFDSIGSRATHQGCQYKLHLGHHQYAGTLAEPCDADVVVTRFEHPYDANDINVYREMRYSARFYQAGLAGEWQNDNWRLRAAYLYHRLQRDHIDDALEARGEATFTTNQSLMLDVAYRVSRNVALTVAAQYFHHQFTGEIPFTYNSITAKHFGRQYGLLSTGAVVTF